jgi:anti-sigma B factor antagonist
MPDLEIQTSSRPGGIRVMSLRGPLTLNTLFEFQNLVRSEQTGLIIDLGEVPYMDSAGLGAVLGALASCQRHGLKFALANVPERVLTLFRVSKVDSLLPQFMNVAAAEA